MSELDDIIRLAGINEFKGFTPYNLENISKTGTEKRKIEKEKNIKPGDEDWFKLWFSLPGMTGANFRGRKK
jgi:hypothetical protein